MPIIQFLVVIILIGVILWAVNSFVPMDAKIKQIMNVVIVIAVVLWAISLFLPIGNLSTVRIGNP